MDDCHGKLASPADKFGNLYLLNNLVHCVELLLYKLSGPYSKTTVITDCICHIGGYFRTNRCEYDCSVQPSADTCTLMDGGNHQFKSEFIIF